MKIILKSDCDCSSCGVPLFTGEAAHRDPETGLVACSQAHLADVIDEKKDFDLIALFSSNFNANGIVLV